MWIYLPETKGYVLRLSSFFSSQTFVIIKGVALISGGRRSAAEIDELYERKIPAWRWQKTVTAAEETMHAAIRAREVGDEKAATTTVMAGV